MSMRKPIALITECRREPRVRSSLRILCSLSYSNTWYRNERMHSHSLPPSSRSPSFATAALRQRQRRLIGELTLPALIFALPQLYTLPLTSLPSSPTSSHSICLPPR